MPAQRDARHRRPLTSPLFGGMILLAVTGMSAAADDTPVLVRLLVRGDRSVTTEAGVLLADDAEHLRLFDLRTGGERTFKKSQIRSLTNPATEQDVAAVTGIAPLVSWFIAQTLPSRPKSGQIASVDGAWAYINRGAVVGLRKGERLDLFRGSGQDIVDPETGEVLGSTQKRLGQVEVVEVQQKLSKVRATGEFEIELAIGDVVRPVAAEHSVAVLPLGLDSGERVQGGVQLAEQITTGLTKNGVTVVERTVLDKILAEQSLGDTGKFDADTIQRVGKLLQAQAVVSGTIQINGRTANVNIRLIDVESGKVLYAASLQTMGINAKPTNSGENPAKEPGTMLRDDEAVVPLDIPDGTVELKNSLGMALVLIPAGEFNRGAPPAQHRVQITKPYFLGKHEVTLTQFSIFVRRSKYITDGERRGFGWGWSNEVQNFGKDQPEYSWRDPGWRPYEGNHPVVNVTWNDVVAFCEWLGRKERRNYRLPTEAEWEYAYRAGTSKEYPQGDGYADLVKAGNVADMTTAQVFTGRPLAPGHDGFMFTAPVGRFQANSWKLHDMVGNVWEWCSDWYDPMYYDAAPVADPPGAPVGTQRVLRGSSWYGHPTEATASFRNHDAPDSLHGANGFRVVLEP